jgi:hypothetical protein
MIARKEPFSCANCCQSGSSLWVWMYAFLKVGLLSLLQLRNKARSYLFPPDSVKLSGFYKIDPAPETQKPNWCGTGGTLSERPGPPVTSKTFLNS